jgi:DNA-binding transcriptional ArsR family regulator
VAAEERAETADDALLETLGDGASRAILVATSDRPMTAKELTERCGVSPTTVYRRINALVERGLLEKRVSLDAGASQHTVYEPTFTRADFRLTPDGVSVQTFDDGGEAALLARLVAEVSSEDLDLQIEGDELTLSLRPADHLLRALGRALRER